MDSLCSATLAGFSDLQTSMDQNNETSDKFLPECSISYVYGNGKF